MDSTIVASLIAAAASILVALLGRTGSPTAARNRGGSTWVYSIPRRHRAIWMTSVGVLMAWMVFAALFLHWDAAGTSAVVIPPVIWILSAVFPIKPASAAAATLVLFPFAFLAEPVAKWRHGISFENHVSARLVGVYVGVAFGAALVAWLLSRLRRKGHWTTPPEAAMPVSPATLAQNLAELAELHRAGSLSDEEFARAKSKLLSAP